MILVVATQAPGVLDMMVVEAHIHGHGPTIMLIVVLVQRELDKRF